MSEWQGKKLQKMVEVYHPEGRIEGGCRADG